MKLYTKTGDQGDTGLFAGPRVRKDDPRIEACGTVDELNSVVGWAREEAAGVDELLQLLSQIQHQLFALGAELATPDPDQHATRLICAADITRLEEAIDRMDAQLPPLTQFVLPGGSRASASLHLARSVCRRAERRVVTLRSLTASGVSSNAVIFLNRLGDLLFVAARFANQFLGQPDIAWQKPDREPREASG